MASSISSEGTGHLHSAKVSTIYLFNLVVGAGALALPLAFAMTGWVLGIIAIIVLATMSFVTSTFMVEAMSIANAVSRRERNSIGVDNPTIEGLTQTPAEYRTINSETAPLIENDDYNIDEKMEMGQMARLFFNKAGITLFYIVIAVYLYGDLAIYAAAVPKSLTRVTCSNLAELRKHANSSAGGKEACSKHLSQESTYRLYLLAFTLVMGPFAFFDLGKTKYLQILTTLFRWLAFILMIILAFYGIEKHEKKAKTFDISQLPNFFGVSVYSFMCQHSLPSILTPIKDKKKVNAVITTSFIAVASFYVLLTITSVFCFPIDQLQDIYTLNFLDAWPGFAYFLALFPVFTLSTNFPIIAITLRENLKSIFQREGKSYPVLVDRVVFPLATVLPPIGIAFVTQNVELLVGVTGSYAGSLIQYVIPVMLVFCGRKKAKSLFGIYVNKHRSIFRQRSWIFFVIVWTILCISLVTAKHILDIVGKKKQ